MSDRPAVVEPAAAWPGARLLARADELARLLPAGRLLVWTSRAVEVIVALAACGTARAELFFAGHALDYEAIEEIAAARRMNAVLYEGDARPRGRAAWRRTKIVPRAVHVVRAGPDGRPRARRVPALASWPPDPSANWLLAHPPASVAGLAVILAAAAGGGALVVSGGAPEALCVGLRRRSVTHVSAGPGAWEGVLAAMVRGERIPHVKWLCVTGGKPELAARLARQFPQARVITDFPLAG